MKLNLIASLLVAGAILAPVAATAAVSLPQFTVSTTSIPGATGTLVGLGIVNSSFDADKLTGSYDEIVTVDNTGAFTSKVVATFTGFTLNAGNVNNTGINSTYVLYAVLEASGTASATSFLATAASIDIFIDTGVSAPATATTFAFGADANAAITWANTADDYKIGSAPSLALNGAVDLIVPAAFNFFFKDFALTDTDQMAGEAGTQSGKTFFTAPADFYVNIHSDGDINSQDVATLAGLAAEAVTTGSATRTLSGELSADFARPVPEPTGLALTGLALAALGLVSRRRKAA